MFDDDLINTIPIPDVESAESQADECNPCDAKVPNPNRHQSQASQGKPKKVITFSSSLDEPIKLHRSENPWKPCIKEENLYRKVRCVLNKLTLQKFDTLLNQMKELDINTEEKLKGIADMIFERALEEKLFCATYANMCKKLAMIKVPLTEKEGKYINFRKLLLTKSQKEFDLNKTNKIQREIKLKQIQECNQGDKKRLQKELEEEEHRYVQRQLGNMKFMGELFKLGMLMEPIIHECIKQLLTQGDENSLQCLCQLLTTAGNELDTRKDSNNDSSKKAMNHYFNEIQNIVTRRNTSTRVRFMLQDVIDLRSRNWIPRGGGEDLKMEKAHQDTERNIYKKEQPKKVLQNVPFVSKQSSNENERNSADTSCIPGSGYDKDSSIQLNKSEGANYEFDALKSKQFSNKKLDSTVIPVKSASKTLPMADIKHKLQSFITGSYSNEEIFDWVEGNIRKEEISEPSFVRALITALFECNITGPAECSEVSLKELKERVPLLLQYVAKKEDSQLEALYAVQALINQLGHPKGVLRGIFDFLYDEDIITEETFKKWEISDNPAEQVDKDVALSSVRSFFTWLREADDESEEG